MTTKPSKLGALAAFQGLSQGGKLNTQRWGHCRGQQHEDSKHTKHKANITDNLNEEVMFLNWPAASITFVVHQSQQWKRSLHKYAVQTLL